MSPERGDLERIVKLDGAESYNAWRFQIRIYLKSNGTFDVATGKVVRPIKGENESDGDFNKREAEWLKKDFAAQKIIATSVIGKPLIHIINCETSFGMWSKLETIFDQQNETSIHLLQERFYKYAKDSSDDIATHISKLEELAWKMERLGEKVSDSMLITKILMTLPSSFSHFHTAWDLTDETKRTLAILTARLIMEESRINAGEKYVALTSKNYSNKGNKNANRNVKSIGNSPKSQLF